MSQFCQKRLKIMASTALLTLGMSAVTATAAINNPGLKAPVTQNFTQSMSLSALNMDIDAPVLDWRNPIYSVKFDVPNTDWTSAVTFTLSIDPVGGVDTKAPIYVQLNTDTPVKLNTRGAGFDARVELDPAKIRPRGNVLRVYYAAPQSADCLSAEHGAWVINLEASKLTLRRNAKSRNLRVRDVEDILSNPLTAPKSISLVSKGSGATALQSLVAQGVGLRMENLPKFSNTQGQSDFEIIAGRRDVIMPYVRSETIFNTHGPRLILDEGRPMRLVLTGDTDEEVLNLAQQFAGHSLPNTSRSITSTGEIVMQPLLSSDEKIVSRSIKLSELGDTAFDPSWNPKDRVLTFDVEDPNASQGEILLRLASPKSILNNDGALTLNLNGHTLGQTKFNKTRKSVAFKVPSGILKGQNNHLRMEADLNLDSAESCSAQAYTDNGIYLGQGSRLILSKASDTPLTDLSRFAATGAPFSDESGKETLIVLPRGNADYQIALGLLGQLAKSSGESWKYATYTRDIENIEALAEGKNILLLVPSKDLPSRVRTNAPKSLQSALRGQSFNGDNLLQAAIDRYAGLDAQDVYRSVAQKTAARNQINKGGAAAIYRSPYSPDKLIGVVTNTPGQSFKTAVQTLKQADHWNALEGSVARWSQDSVLMTELSSDIPSFVRTKPATSTTVMPSFVDSNFDLPSFEAVKFKFAEFNWPSFSDLQTPEVEVSRLKFWDDGNAPAETKSAEEDSFLDVALRGSENEPVQQNTKVASVSELNLRGLSSVNLPPQNGILANAQEKIEGLTNMRFTKPSVKVPDFKLPKLELETSITSIQRELKPLRQSWKAKLRGLSIPGKSTAKWGLNQISAAALFLILMFSLAVLFLGFASPENRSGSHH